MDRGGREILAFVVLAYGASWAVWIPMAVHGTVVHAGSLPSHFLGLAGPLIAALMLNLAAPSPEGDAFFARLVRVPDAIGAWLLALAPLLALAGLVLLAPWIGMAINVAGLSRFSGLPQLPLSALFLIVLLLNGFGEEAGWRGYLLPRLQARLGAVRGVLAQAVLWIGWHAPLFWIVATYRGMGPAMLVFGFGLGLVLGAFVLAQVSAASGGSVFAAALWHTGYNFATATDGGAIVQAGISAMVMVWGALLLGWALASPAGRRAITVPGFDKVAAAP